jgi:hypothetical protein
MTYNFDFEHETEPIDENTKFGSARQRETAEQFGCTHILVRGYGFSLPKYIQSAAAKAGYGWVQLGYTTRRSSTWGFFPRF